MESKVRSALQRCKQIGSRLQNLWITSTCGLQKCMAWHVSLDMCVKTVSASRARKQVHSVRYLCD